MNSTRCRQRVRDNPVVEVWPKHEEQRAGDGGLCLGLYLEERKGIEWHVDRQ